MELAKRLRRRDRRLCANDRSSRSNRAGVSSENGGRGEIKNRRAGRGVNRSQQLSEYTLLCREMLQGFKA